MTKNCRQPGCRRRAEPRHVYCDAHIRELLHAFAREPIELNEAGLRAILMRRQP